LLDTLLEVQTDLIKRGSSLSEDKIEELITSLKEKSKDIISDEEIESICQAKREIIYLEEII
jgi:hypothetical protein